MEIDPMKKTIALKKRRYKVAIIIGRFQINHLGHNTLFDQARNVSDHVIVMVGSSGIARNIKNPFNYLERDKVLRSNYARFFEQFETRPIYDDLYSDKKWAAQIQNHVSGYSDDEVVLIGHNKDASTYYLEMFPRWDYIEAPSNNRVNATQLREAYFNPEEFDKNYILNNVTIATSAFLQQFSTTDHFTNLAEEYKYLTKYWSQFKDYKYPPIFFTADAVVLCGSNILMVQRGSNPGKGQWALPGGFLNSDERIKDGIFRELIEETKIGVPERELRLCLKHRRTFDAPSRSLRARVITEAGLIVLVRDELPFVKGSDDAKHAEWMPIDRINRMGEQIFEDHLSIIRYMVNKVED